MQYMITISQNASGAEDGHNPYYDELEKLTAQKWIDEFDWPEVVIQSEFNYYDEPNTVH